MHIQLKNAYDRLETPSCFPKLEMPSIFDCHLEWLNYRINEPAINLMFTSEKPLNQNYLLVESVSYAMRLCVGHHFQTASSASFPT